MTSYVCEQLTATTPQTCESWVEQPSSTLPPLTWEQADAIAPAIIYAFAGVFALKIVLKMMEKLT